MRRLWRAALRLVHQVRLRHRLAKLLQAARLRGDGGGSQLRHASHRSPLRALWSTSWTSLPGRSEPDRDALLHQFLLARLREEGGTEMSEVATLGGGCFWCLDAAYRQLKGVEKVVSGYAGGARPNPSYEQVCTGATGHAGVVQITFDTAVITVR